MNTIRWSKKAQKQLLKLPKNEALNIYDKVEDLKKFPDCQNVKRLTNHRYEFRMRVGNYRVLFDHDSDIKIVSIEEVKKRDERTY
jgi:mRNA interferase RelE/StbE